MTRILKSLCGGNKLKGKDGFSSYFAAADDDAEFYHHILIRLKYITNDKTTTKLNTVVLNSISFFLKSRNKVTLWFAIIIDYLQVIINGIYRCFSILKNRKDLNYIFSNTNLVNLLYKWYLVLPPLMPCVLFG